MTSGGRHSTEGATDALIDDLVTGLEPVSPLRFGAALSICLAAQLLALAVSLWDPHLRAAAFARLESGWFIAAASASLLGATACAVAAVRMAVPGREPRSSVWVLFVTPLLLAAAALWVWHGRWLGLHDVLMGCRTCLSGMVTTAATPWFVMLFVLRRYAPLRPARVAMLAGMAAMFLGALVTDVRCPAQDGIHLAVGHYLPVAVLSAFGCALAVLVLRNHGTRSS